MKKFIAFLVIGLFAIAGIALASTVSTTDGQNYIITNDSGTPTQPLIMNAIIQKVNQFKTRMQSDSVAYVSDQETYDSWMQVWGMANASLANWQAQQPVPVVNTVTNSVVDNSTNSVSVGTEAPAGNMDVQGTVQPIGN